MIKNENGFIYNVFISYHGSLGKLYAESIYSKLIIHNIKFDDQSIVPFFAPHDIHKGSSFENVITAIMPQISVFIMVLTPDYFVLNEDMDEDDNMVKLEVDTALNNEKIRFIPILEKNEDYWSNKDYFGTPFTSEQKRRFTRINPVYYNSDYFFDVENNLIPALQNQLSQTRSDDYSFTVGRTNLGERIKNDKFLEIEGETDRLLEQQRLLQTFDLDVYEKVLKNKPKYILDIGSNDGSALMERINRLGYDEYIKIVGIDISSSLVEIARKKYGEDKRLIFRVLDVEDKGFLKDIKKFMSDNNIEYFDFINISSLLLQLGKPFEFLTVVDEILEPDNGVLLVEDIDDGLNIAYPDNNQLFSRIFNICNKCIMTGYRRTGRQVYTLLSKTIDFKTISFEKSGLNNSKMSKSEKRVFFEIIINFIYSALEKEANEDINNVDLQIDLKWMKDNLENIKEQFFNNDFFFSFGYVVFLCYR